MNFLFLVLKNLYLINVFVKKLYSFGDCQNILHNSENFNKKYES